MLGPAARARSATASASPQRSMKARIAASSPGEKGPLFEPANSKVYRHPTFYTIPDELGHM